MSRTPAEVPQRAQVPQELHLLQSPHQVQRHQGRSRPHFLRVAQRAKKPKSTAFPEKTYRNDLLPRHAPN